MANRPPTPFPLFSHVLTPLPLPLSLSFSLSHTHTHIFFLLTKSSLSPRRFTFFPSLEMCTHLTPKKRSRWRSDARSFSYGHWALEPTQAAEVSPPRHHFCQILALSGHIFRRYHLFWNEHSTIYKSIPILMDESSSLKSGSLFTLCIPWLFLVNQGSFVRWDPPKLHVLFVSFRLIYILIMFWGHSKNTIYEIELSIWVLSRFMCRANQGLKLKIETISQLVLTPQT